MHIIFRHILYATYICTPHELLVDCLLIEATLQLPLHTWVCVLSFAYGHQFTCESNDRTVYI